MQLKKSALLLLSVSLLCGDSLNELIDYAKSHATVVQTASLNAKLSQLKKKESKANQFGELDIVGSATMYNRSRTLIPLTPAIIQSGVHVVSSKELYSLGASYTLPLFTGFAQQQDVAINQMAEKMAQIRAELTDEELIYNVRALYLSILGLQENLKAQDAYIEALDSLTQLVAKEVEYGKKAKIDLLKAQADYEAARLQRATILNNIELTKSSLSVLVGKDVEDIEPLAFDLTKQEESLESLLAQVNGLKKVEVENIAVQKAQKAIKKGESQNWPQLQLAAYAGKNFAEDESTQVFDNEDLWQVGLNLKWNIFDFGKTTASIESAKIAKLKEDVAKKDTLRKLEKSLKDAWHTMQLHYTEYLSNTAQYELAKESAAIEQVRYENDAATLNDLLLAKSKAQLALSGVIASKYNYQKSKYYIQYLMERGDKSE